MPDRSCIFTFCTVPVTVSATPFHPAPKLIHCSGHFLHIEQPSACAEALQALWHRARLFAQTKATEGNRASAQIPAL